MSRLLAAVYDRHVQTVLGAVLAAVEAAPREIRPRLERGLSAFVDGTLADERAARINYFEMVGVSRELEAHRRGVLRLYAEFIAAQVEELDPAGTALPGDRLLAAIALVGAVDGLITAWMSGEEPGRDREAIIHTLLEIFAPDKP